MLFILLPSYGTVRFLRHCKNFLNLGNAGFHKTCFFLGRPFWYTGNWESPQEVRNTALQDTEISTQNSFSQGKELVKARCFQIIIAKNQIIITKQTLKALYDHVNFLGFRCLLPNGDKQLCPARFTVSLKMEQNYTCKHTLWTPF